MNTRASIRAALIAFVAVACNKADDAASTSTQAAPANGMDAAVVQPMANAGGSAGGAMNGGMGSGMAGDGSSNSMAAVGTGMADTMGMSGDGGRADLTARLGGKGDAGIDMDRRGGSFESSGGSSGLGAKGTKEVPGQKRFATQ